MSDTSGYYVDPNLDTSGWTTRQKLDYLRSQGYGSEGFQQAGSRWADVLNVATIGGSNLIGDVLGIKPLQASQYNIGGGPGARAVSSILSPGASAGALAGRVYGPAYEAWTGRPYTPSSSAGTVTTAGGTGGIPLPGPGESYTDFARRQLAARGAGPNYGGIAARQNAELERAAKEYWKNVQQYGQARSRALGDMYSRLASTTARSGADVGQRGLEAATSIEQLYQNLANRAVELSGGGGGMVTPQTATSGLVPVSGEVAMAAQQIPAAGASLADYLRGTAGAEAGGLEALSRAQAEQGVSSVAEYLNQIAMAKMVADYERAQQMAANRARAAAAAASARANEQAILDAAASKDFEASRQRQQLSAMYGALYGSDEAFKKRLDATIANRDYRLPDGSRATAEDIIRLSPETAATIFMGAPAQ